MNTGRYSGALRGEAPLRGEPRNRVRGGGETSPPAECLQKE
jgi:hypothetical protein